MTTTELIKLKRRRRKGAAAATSYRQIARELNVECVAALRGGQWSAEQVRRVLLGGEPKSERRTPQVRKQQLAWDDYLTIDQVRHIAASLSGTLQILFWFMVGTGLRRAEVAAVRAGDIDLSKRQVTVRRGKGARLRTVLIGSALAQRLGSHMRRNCAGKRSPLFCTPEGGVLKVWQVTWRVERMRKVSRIDWLHPHVLRHTFGTVLYNYKKDIIFVQNQMGHRKLETTAIYAKSYVESGYEQMDGMDGLLGL